MASGGVFQRLFAVRGSSPYRFGLSSSASSSSFISGCGSSNAFSFINRSLFSTTTLLSSSISTPVSSSSSLLGSLLNNLHLSRRWASTANTVTYTNPAFPLVGKVEPKNPPTVYTPPLELNKQVRSVFKVDADTRQEKLQPLEDSFAIMAINGKQYKVTAGDVFHTDKLPLVEPGDVIQLDKVLLVGTKENTFVGTPVLPNARVVVVVEQQTKAEKIIIFKKKRRKNYRRTKGFRPEITVLRVLEVLYGSELYPDAPTFQHFYPEPKFNPVTKKPVSPDTMLDRLAVMDKWSEERREAKEIRAERKRDSKRGMTVEGVKLEKVRRKKEETASHD